MVRRRLTLKRIDPWSVLKFGFVANLSLLAIWLLGGAVMWFFVRRLQLIEKVCSIATDVGFTSCGVNGGNLFRAVLLLGVLGVVILTGLVVFFAFLANLIAELTGGLSFTFADETAGAAGRGEVAAGSGRGADGRERRSDTGSGAATGSGVGGAWSSASAGSGERGDTTTVQKDPPRPLGSEDDRIFGERQGPTREERTERGS